MEEYDSLKKALEDFAEQTELSPKIREGIMDIVNYVADNPEVTVHDIVRASLSANYEETENFVKDPFLRRMLFAMAYLALKFGEYKRYH